MGAAIPEEGHSGWRYAVSLLVLDMWRTWL